MMRPARQLAALIQSERVGGRALPCPSQDPFSLARVWEGEKKSGGITAGTPRAGPPGQHWPQAEQPGGPWEC